MLKYYGKRCEDVMVWFGLKGIAYCAVKVVRVFESRSRSEGERWKAERFGERERERERAELPRKRPEKAPFSPEAPTHFTRYSVYI